MSNEELGLAGVAAGGGKRLSKAQTVDAEAILASAEARNLLDDEQYEQLLTLPWSARVLTLARMEQVLAWIRADHDRRDAADYAGRAATDVSRFYRMVDGWDRSRSIVAFGSAARVLAPRPPKVPVDVRMAVEAEMCRLLEDQPEALLEELIEAGTRAEVSGIPGRTTLYKWAKDLKAAASNKPFGTPLLGIVPLEAELDDGTQPDVAVVVDRNTGLLLGAANATRMPAYEAYEQAADDAHRRLSDIRLRGVRPTRGRIDLRLADFREPGYEIQTMRVIGRKNASFTSIDAGKAARIIRAAVGDRLGYLKIAKGTLPWRLGKGATFEDTTVHPQDADARDWPRLTKAEFEWVLDRAVDRIIRADLDRTAGGESMALHAVRMRVRKVLADMRKEES